MTNYNDVANVPRERKSVPILGLDTSTPDDLVEDGKCAELNNLRYKDGAWRTVHGFSELASLPGYVQNEYGLVYHHPAAGEKTYITLHKSIPSRYGLLDCSAGYESPVDTLIDYISDVTGITHFGNVLIFYIKDNPPRYYVYKDGKYNKFTFPDYARTVERDAIYQIPTPTSTRYIIDGEHTWQPTLDRAGGSSASGFFYAIHNITQDVSLTGSTKEDAWHGEFLLFTTFTMIDGTQICPSPLHLFKSYTPVSITSPAKRKIAISHDPVWIYRGEKSSADADSSQDLYLGIYITTDGEELAVSDAIEGSLCSCVSSLQIRHSLTDPQSALISGVSVWVTRLNPIYKISGYGDISHDPIDQPRTKDGVNLNGVDLEGIVIDNTRSSTNYRQGSSSRNANAASFTDFYADNDLANQPFYLLKEIALEEFSGKSIELNLTKELLYNAINNQVYTPNNNIHDYMPAASLDYNARLHVGGGSISLNKGYDLSDLCYTTAFSSGYVSTQVEIGNDTYSVREPFIYDEKGSRNARFPFSRIVSYPDYRAKQIKATPYAPISLKSAIGNNFAWQHAPHTDVEKFPAFPYTPFSGGAQPSIYDKRVVPMTNTVRVSASNNLFSSSFSNSYSFGSQHNHILAMQSAAMPIADEKTGDLPLIVFTTEGIFALRAGTQTLYARTDAINYDKIINPNTLAVNGGIIYITEKGVHLMVGVESKVISTPIHDINGIPPLDFLKECKLILSKQYNEVIFLNESAEDGRAYIYNIENGYWSTRDLSGKKLNTDELVNGNHIYDLSDEDEKTASLQATLTTRPIKLGDVEFKRLETIIPRMSVGDYEWRLEVNAARTSPDDWSLLRQTDSISSPRHPAIIRRTPYSAKYFQFTLNKGIGDGFAITHFDVEWYKRFRRRMR